MVLEGAQEQVLVDLVLMVDQYPAQEGVIPGQEQVLDDVVLLGVPEHAHVEVLLEDLEVCQGGQGLFVEDLVVKPWVALEKVRKEAPERDLVADHLGHNQVVALQEDLKAHLQQASVLEPSQDGDLVAFQREGQRGDQGRLIADQGGLREDQGGQREDQGRPMADQGGLKGDQGGQREDQGETLTFVLEVVLHKIPGDLLSEVQVWAPLKDPLMEALVLLDQGKCQGVQVHGEV